MNKKIENILSGLSECIIKAAWLDRNTEGIIYWQDDGLDRITLNLPLVLAESVIEAYTRHQQPNWETEAVNEAIEKAMHTLSPEELKFLGQKIGFKLGLYKKKRPTKKHFKNLAHQISDFAEQIKISRAWINKKTRYRWQISALLINIDLMVAEILIHEWLHHRYPDASETLIIAKTSNQIKRLSRQDLNYITNSALGS